LFNLLGQDNVHFDLELLDSNMSFIRNSIGFNSDGKLPFSLKFNNESLISEGDLFNFLEVEEIDFLDS